MTGCPIRPTYRGAAPYLGRCASDPSCDPGVHTDKHTRAHTRAHSRKPTLSRCVTMVAGTMLCFKYLAGRPIGEGPPRSVAESLDARDAEAERPL